MSGGELFDVTVEPGELGFDGFDAPHRGLTRFGQADTTRMPLDRCHAEFGFEFANLLRDCRRRVAQLRGGSRTPDCSNTYAWGEKS